MEREVDTQHLIEACWVDDVVLILQAEQPDTLIRKIQVAVGITQDTAMEFGLALNYGPDKTAALIALRGNGAKQQWQQLMQANPHQPALQFQCASLMQPGRLDIVPNYVYLGQLQDQQGHQGCEVRRRFLLVQATGRILQKNIFKSPKMPMKTRKQLFQSLVVSKLVYGAGSWQMTQILTARAWHRQVMQLYAKIVARVSPGPNHYHLDTLAICELPHPMLLLAIQRFGLFERVMNTDMSELFALLQQQDPQSSWFTCVLNDLQRLSDVLPDHEAFAHTQPADLAKFCLNSRRVLSKLAKWAVRHYVNTLQLWKAFRLFQQQFDNAAREYGFQWDIDHTLPQQPAAFSCSQCQAVFPTYKALCTHTYKKHADHNIVQRFTASNFCRSCLKAYHSRAQVIHHLKYLRTGCLPHLMATVQPLPDDELQQILQEERELKANRKKQQRVSEHKWPVTQASGPKRPWPWQQSHRRFPADTRDLPLTDENILQGWHQQVLSTLDDNDVSLTYATLQQQPYHGALLPALLQAFAAFQFSTTQERLQAFAVLQEAVHLWTDDPSVPMPEYPPGPQPRDTLHALTCIRAPNEPPPQPDLPVGIRRQLLVDQLWLENTVQWQLRRQMYIERSKMYIAASPRDTPSVQDPIFLYIFSGRRREGDFQGHVEGFLRQRGIQARVLMLDLALSEHHDVGDEALVTTLRQWFSAGFVAGLLIAPPCETWSQARHLELEHEVAPRPLRSAMDPFGVPKLHIRENEQLAISSFLLYVTIRLLLEAAMNTVPAVVEHPQEPKLRDRASIWRLPWFQFFEQQGLMRRHLIWQGHYQAAAPKPTHLGAFHLPEFAPVMQSYKIEPDWQALVRLGGKEEETGQWRTSRAKEYPGRLNEALAALLVTAHERRCRETAAAGTLSPQAKEQFARLYAGDVDLSRQTIQPDFHRRTVHLEDLD